MFTKINKKSVIINVIIIIGFLMVGAYIFFAHILKNDIPAAKENTNEPVSSPAAANQQDYSYNQTPTANAPEQSSLINENESDAADSPTTTEGEESGINPAQTNELIDPAEAKNVDTMTKEELIAMLGQEELTDDQIIAIKKRLMELDNALFADTSTKTPLPSPSENIQFPSTDNIDKNEPSDESGTSKDTEPSEVIPETPVPTPTQTPIPEKEKKNNLGLPLLTYMTFDTMEDWTAVYDDYTTLILDLRPFSKDDRDFKMAATDVLYDIVNGSTEDIDPTAKVYKKAEELASKYKDLGIFVSVGSTYEFVNGTFGSPDGNRLLVRVQVDYFVITKKDIQETGTIHVYIDYNKITDETKIIGFSRYAITAFGL